MSTLDAFSLVGKRALVTGGSRGLGLGMAQGLRDAGASVLSVARTDTGDFDGILGQVGDVSDLESIPTIVDDAEARLGGRIDLVLHAAGIQHRSPARDFPVAEWENVIKVNLTAPFVLSQEIGARQLADGEGGVHLLVASLTSVLGFPNMAAYAASKSGVMGIVRSLSTEWAGSGIRVNGVAPGYFRTALTEALFSDAKETERLAARIPMGRFGEPKKDLAGSAIFLMSDAASYITGQLLCVDGGWTSA